VRIKPLDIRNHAFPKRVSGYDREEVDTFLRMVAEDYEAALRDGERLRSQLGRHQARIQELEASEKLLQETLTTAQHLSEDLKRTAMKEAEVMISEAEIQGERVLEAAHRRAARLAEDIREMKYLRIRLAEALRATLESHLRLVDGLASDEGALEDPALEGRIAVLTRLGKDKGGPEG
jgi:cell division initiation protein